MKTRHSVLGGFESSEGLAPAQHLGGPRDKSRLWGRVGHSLVLLLTRPAEHPFTGGHRAQAPLPAAFSGGQQVSTCKPRAWWEGKTAGPQSRTSADVGSGPRSAHVTTEPCQSHFASLILRFSI